MMSKFDDEWPVEQQLDLIHQNMLPAVQQLLKRHQVGFVDRLLELAREAEDLILAGRNYELIPKPGECLLPELAFREIDVSKQAIGAQAGIAAVTSALPADWAKLIERAVEAKFQEMQRKLAQNKTAPSPANDAARGGRMNKPASPKPQKRLFSKSMEKLAEKPAAKTAESSAVTSKSDKNKNKIPGPRASVLCWEGSKPGHTKLDGPECSLKEQGSVLTRSLPLP